MTQECLIQKLKIKQIGNRLTDLEFSKSLGIGRTTWREAKMGLRPVGLALLKAIVRNYPELDRDVIQFLQDGTGIDVVEGS